MRKSWITPPSPVQLRSVATRYTSALALGLHVHQTIQMRMCRERVLRRGRRRQGECEANLENEDPAQKMARLEAVLFVAREPLSSRKLSQYASLADGTEARTLVRHLNKRLDSSGRAFRVQEVAGGFQLTTRQKFAKWLRRLDHVPSAERLTAPALETLAVVAYRQPVIRADVEAIRGVACGEILNQLMNRDLVRVGGRSEELGRPYLYATTKRFLQVFALRSLEELPKATQFRGTMIQPTSTSVSDPDVKERDSEVEEES